MHTTVPRIGLKTAYESCCAHTAISILVILHFINSIPTGFRVRMVSVLSLSYERIRSGHMKWRWASGTSARDESARRQSRAPVPSPGATAEAGMNGGPPAPAGFQKSPLTHQEERLRNVRSVFGYSDAGRFPVRSPRLADLPRTEPSGQSVQRAVFASWGSGYPLHTSCRNV